MENKLIAKNNKGEIVKFKIRDIGKGFKFTICSRSNLTEIISIPNIHINDLFFTENQLTSLPELPQTLECLYCKNNKIEKLPNLTKLQNLKEVYCDIQCFEHYMLEMENIKFDFFC